VSILIGFINEILPIVYDCEKKLSLTRKK